MDRFVRLFVFFGTFLVTHQQEKNINDTIRSLFQIPVPTTISTVDDCKCVPYYLCRYNNMVTTDGRGIINVKAGLNPCNHYMDFCCKLEDVTATAMTPLDDMKPGCGWRNFDGVGFRTVGDFEGEAKFGEFPWMVAILHEERFEGLNEALASYQCGGSLIHPQAVITAAHCVVTNGKKNFIIRAGEWDSQMTKEIYPSQDRTVRSITVHPNYYSGGLFNDIAVLLLDAPVNMTMPNVGVACLPPQGTVIPGGTTCFASGWGKKIFGKKGEYQAILKKIDLPIVERTRCQNDLRSTRLGKYFRLDQSFICAGGEDGKDTCKGDGGSPLVCPIPGQKDRYQQGGIVAWGIGCGTKGVPGAYANVALFRNWIDDQMALNNLDTTTYAY